MLSIGCIPIGGDPAICRVAPRSPAHRLGACANRFLPQGGAQSRPDRGPRHHQQGCLSSNTRVRPAPEQLEYLIRIPPRTHFVGWATAPSPLPILRVCAPSGYVLIRSRFAVIRRITRRNSARSSRADAFLRRVGDAARERQQLVAHALRLGVSQTCDRRCRRWLRTRRIRPDFSMLRSAMTVVGSIMPTRADSSRCERPSSVHSTRRKYHCPRVTP